MELLAAQVGRPLSEVETPVPVIDLDRLEANLTDLQSYTDRHGIALWPHTKTHKSPEIGLRQLALGAGGLTVAKTGEAQVFPEAGAPRILVHYPPFGADKWERLAGLAAYGLELTVAVDGIAPPKASQRRRAPRVEGRAARRDRRRAASHGSDHLCRCARGGAGGSSKLPAVEVAGISCYPGHCRRDAPTMPQRGDGFDALLLEARDAFAAAGTAHRSHLGRSTPTALPDPRDVCQRAAFRHLRPARSQRG